MPGGRRRAALLAERQGANYAVQQVALVGVVAVDAQAGGAELVEQAVRWHQVGSQLLDLRIPRCDLRPQPFDLIPEQAVFRAQLCQPGAADLFGSGGSIKQAPKRLHLVALLRFQPAHEHAGATQGGVGALLDQGCTGLPANPGTLNLFAAILAVVRIIQRQRIADVVQRRGRPLAAHPRLERHALVVRRKRVGVGDQVLLVGHASPSCAALAMSSAVRV
ncbi:hypothetical protein D9M70_361690 [compost metagenome]